MRWFAFIVLFIGAVSVFSLTPRLSLASATTGTCSASYSTKTDTSDKTKVGVFMVGVCSECWDIGDCSLNDILQVVANIGNFILSIVGGLVFLAYILGGFWWIASHGDTKWVQKGKDYIKNATLGLMIVLFAYAGVYTLESIIKSGSVSAESDVICDGSAESLGKSCGVNKLCTASGCYSKCEIGNMTEGSIKRTCYDTNLGVDDYINISDCTTNLCPGGETTVCCAYYEHYQW